MRKSHAGCIVNRIPRTQHGNYYDHVVFIFSIRRSFFNLRRMFVKLFQVLSARQEASTSC
jgi:hypothetical protein